ncbi:MAG TPA: hypothetical protein VJ810_07200 [Blastocatellia bacterium]|nr:hypothetical protein [Blastocatellia bacterium]
MAITTSANAIARAGTMSGQMNWILMSIARSGLNDHEEPAPA